MNEISDFLQENWPAIVRIIPDWARIGLGGLLGISLLLKGLSFCLKLLIAIVNQVGPLRNACKNNLGKKVPEEKNKPET